MPEDGTSEDGDASDAEGARSPRSESSEVGDDHDESTSVAFDERALEAAPEDGEPTAARALEAASEDESATDPLAGLADRVVEHGAETDDHVAEELFDREDVTELDSDLLWEELEGDADAGIDPDRDDREYRTISKRKYCHQCEHFAAPPEVGCTNEGTEIIELTSMDSFRVVDCPVVLEDEALEKTH
ncbi:DUF1818 family protein [Natronosalvus vescus]|uniref:DUF1818 family protein n=1 Tax=Natronosalvus vescus TaxID=2953881 RepID=UPI0020900FF7|nr:DUF1818 family protein [Natronosalvus vescus]